MSAFALLSALAGVARAHREYKDPIHWNNDDLVGKGGYGKVFRGRDQNGNSVAGKVIGDPASFRRERDTLKLMSGTPGFPEFVGTYETMRRRKNVIATNWLWGKTLNAHPNLPLAKVVAIGDQLLKILGRLHAKGIVHQDVKPQNVMMDVPPGSGGRAELTLFDFGESMRIGEYRFRGHGTPAYRGPELDQGGTAVTPASDVLGAAGVMLYLATGSHPFPRAAELQRASLPGELSAHRQRRTNVAKVADPALRQVLHKALSPNVADRYQSAAEFRWALRSVRRGAAPP